MTCHDTTRATRVIRWIPFAILNALLLIPTSQNAVAQATLVADINPGSSSSSPTAVVEAGGVSFFAADNGENGVELWKTDGTEAGTVMVKDVMPGSGSSSPVISSAVELNGELYFRATGPTYGDELWVSNGTEAGTKVVKDIYPGPSGSSQVRFLTVVGSTLFFVASDGIHGAEVWKTDGTEAGTAMVKDIWPGAQDSGVYPSALVEAGGTLYFWMSDGSSFTGGTYGLELWRSDGTEAGTTVVKDIAPGTAGSGLIPHQVINVNGILFFPATDGTTGLELWKSDGTEAGTVLVEDTYSGSTGGCCGPHWADLGGTLIFEAADATNGLALWRSDGTEAGTEVVKAIRPGDDPQIGPMVVVGDVVMFKANDGTAGLEPWRSDGTEAGTQLIKDIEPGAGSSMNTISYITAGCAAAYFRADDPTAGPEPFVSDGTTAGTELAADLNAERSSSPQYFSAIESSVYFSANTTDHGYELWKLDDASCGTTPTAVDAIDDGYEVGEDNTLSVSAPSVLGNDEGTAPLTASLVSGPTYGTLTLNEDGSFTYTPAADYNGPDGFVYQLTDGTNSTDQATVSLTVVPVNDDPVAVDDEYFLDVDIALNVAASAGVLSNDSDIDGDALTASLASPPSSGSVTLNADGSFTYTPNSGFTNTDVFVYTASDNKGGTAVASVTITVHDDGCTRGIGYWKTHGEELGVALADVVWYDGSGLSFEQALTILSTKGSDMVDKLESQLLAAMLNVASGASASAVSSALADATSWLQSDGHIDDDAETEMVEEWKDILDDFNNGFLSPGSCDLLEASEEEDETLGEPAAESEVKAGPSETDGDVTAPGSPAAFEIANYPDPFNRRTRISITLPEVTRVRVTVYDALGRVVRVLLDEERGAGNQQVSFEARDLPSGVYYYRVEAGRFVATHSMVLLR